MIPRNGEFGRAGGRAADVLPMALLNPESGGRDAGMDSNSETPRFCCGEESRSFWAEDGCYKSVCMKCGSEFADPTRVRYRATPWIGVDLDGTLACDLGTWQGGAIGRPIAPMVARVKKWTAEGVTVKVFTARASSPEQVAAIKKWLMRHGLPDLEVTNVKDRLMIELWDDRCVQVSYNAGQPVNDRKAAPKRNRLGERSNRQMPTDGLLSRIRFFLTL